MGNPVSVFVFVFFFCQDVNSFLLNAFNIALVCNMALHGRAMQRVQ